MYTLPVVAVVFINFLTLVAMSYSAPGGVIRLLILPFISFESLRRESFVKTAERERERDDGLKKGDKKKNKNPLNLKK